MRRHLILHEYHSVGCQWEERLQGGGVRTVLGAEVTGLADAGK